LRNIGQWVSEYTAENKGYLPYGTGGIGTGNGPPSYIYWEWDDTLSLMLGQPANPNAPNQCLTTSSVLYDPEVNLYGSRSAHTCDYIANSRVLSDGAMYPDNWGSPSTAATGQVGLFKGTYAAPRAAASIQRSAEVAMAWDNRVNLQAGSVIGPNPYPCNDSMEAWANDYPNYSGFAFPIPYYHTYSGYGRRILLGGGNPTDGGLTSAALTGASLAGEKYDNVDFTNPTWGTSDNGGQYQCEMRFRHINNTTCNILFVDGHVTSYVIGTVTAKMLCVNVNWPAGSTN
jgi:prepilin-type processing-associated H-X9-DG protein